MKPCPLCGKEMIPEWDANDDMGTWLECDQDHTRVKQEQTDFSHSDATDRIQENGKTL